MKFEEMSSRLKNRGNSGLKLLACFLLVWLVPVFSLRGGSNITQEWGEWKFTVSLLCSEVYFGVRFIDSQRVKLFREEFGI